MCKKYVTKSDKEFLKDKTKEELIEYLKGNEYIRQSELKEVLEKNWIETKQRGFYLYKFLDKNGFVLYVGQTNKIPNRINQHLSSNSHLPKYAYENLYKIVYASCNNKNELDSLEGNLILDYKRKYQCVWNSKIETYKYNDNYSIENLVWKEYLTIEEEDRDIYLYNKMS